jgi:hypothetical protein
MKRAQKLRKIDLFLSICLLSLFACAPVVSSNPAVTQTILPLIIPPTGPKTATPDLSIQLTLQAFHSPANLVTKVYSQGVMNYLVVQQPQDDPTFVSKEPGVVTQFQLPGYLGVIGLIAHNYLAGSSFFYLRVGESITLDFENGHQQDFRVVHIKEYKAVDPLDPKTDFIDLDSGEELTASRVFNGEYGGSPHLTLQVSIQKGNIGSWGRRFITAEPIKSENEQKEMLKNNDHRSTVKIKIRLLDQKSDGKEWRSHLEVY